MVPLGENTADIAKAQNSIGEMRLQEQQLRQKSRRKYQPRSSMRGKSFTSFVKI